MKFRNILYTFLAAAAVFSIAIASSLTVSAESPSCPGPIVGQTDVSADLNAGYVDFNGENGGADLSVVGGGTGFAPIDAVDAACVAELGGDTFQIQEYAWNTNAGFINFSDCVVGATNYCDVQIETLNGGERQITGTAWNELFGYIYFSDADPGDGINYGVSIAPVVGSPGLYNVTADSWAWTDSGIWLKFSGPSLTLPNEIEICDPDTDPDCICDPVLNPAACGPDEPIGPDVDVCDGASGACIEIELDLPDVPELGFSVDNVSAIADGVSGYDIIVHLHDDDGNPLVVGSADYDLQSFEMSFDWTDTIKRNQLAGQSGNFDLFESPINSTTGGAVAYKPIDITFDDLVPIDGEPGAYKLSDGKVRSIAPTTSMNVSKLSGVQEVASFLVNNTDFLWPLKDSVGGQVWTDDIESNRLVLNYASYSIENDAGDVVESGTIYANGNKPLSLPFRPAVELYKLYANDNQDIIEASRDIPFWITAEAREIGDTTFVAGASPEIELKINYSIDATQEKCFEGDKYKIHFGGIGDSETFKSQVYSLSELKDAESISAIVELPESDAGPFPCGYVKGPTVYSEISYGASVALPTGGTKKVSVAYYHNKIPRLGGDVIANTQIYVSGIVKGNASYNTTADVQPVTTSGDVNVSIVRSTIHENLVKYSSGSLTGKPGICTITALGEKATKSCGTAGVDYFEFAIGDERVFYTNSDISLDLTNKNWTGKWIIVSDGGHISIDGDVYNEAISEANHVSLIAFRGDKDDIGESGNVYIHPSVKNIQATTIADGTLYSCFGQNDTCLKDDMKSNGVPEGSIDDLVENLQNQLLYQGNIATKNTIGGFNYDKTYQFKMLGSGEVIFPEDETAENIYQVMMEDLHFLRMFKLAVQVDPVTGLPFDQSCQMALTPAMQQQIFGGGEEPVVNEANGLECDGIDSTSVWSGDICYQSAIPDGVTCGDLYVNSDDDRRALGVFESGLAENERNLPVLVIYTKIPESVIFSKQGAVRY